MIVEQHELPLADFVLVVGSGGTTDPASKTGVANLTATMLTRRDDDAKESRYRRPDRIPRNRPRRRPAAGTSSTLSLHTPTAQLDSALALFADVALRPSFPADEFERIRKNRLTELLQLKDRPTAIANQAYRRDPLWRGASIRAQLIWNGGIGQESLSARIFSASTRRTSCRTTRH